MLFSDSGWQGSSTSHRTEAYLLCLFFMSLRGEGWRGEGMDANAFVSRHLLFDRFFCPLLRLSFVEAKG